MNMQKTKLWILSYTYYTVFEKSIHHKMWKYSFGLKVSVWYEINYYKS